MNVVLTEADALADLNGTPRPDNPNAPITEPTGRVLTEADALADLNGTPRPDQTNQDTAP